MVKSATPELVAFECAKCGYEWFPRTTTPVKCPKCQSRDWNNPKKSKEQAA
jgi:predicted Zn-ribbon and HTH transcriptional regulator